MTTRPLGLICAIPDEIAHFGASFAEISTRTLASLTFREGTLEQEIWPAVYYPIAQSPDSSFAVITRAVQSEESVLRSLTAAIREMGPEVVTMPGTTMTERIHRSEPAYLRRYEVSS